MQASSSPKSPPLAGTAPRAWARFAAVVIVILAADLAIKYLAFERVAAYPVRLVADRQTMIDSPPAQLSGEQVVLFDEPDTIQQTPGGIVAVPGVLNFKLTTNTGAVFGLGKGARWLFIGVSVIAIGVIGYLFARSPASAWWHHLGLGLILAGALGNLYDRVVYGAVRDMLYLLPGTGLWPWIFNLADAALMAGVGLVLVLSFRQEATHGPPDRTDAVKPTPASPPACEQRPEPADG